MVDLRRIASERIKETPAVLEARTQSEGGTGLVRAIDRRHFAYHINAGISLPGVMFTDYRLRRRPPFWSRRACGLSTALPFRPIMCRFSSSHVQEFSEAGL